MRTNWNIGNPNNGLFVSTMDAYGSEAWGFTPIFLMNYSTFDGVIPFLQTTSSPFQSK